MIGTWFGKDCRGPWHRADGHERSGMPLTHEKILTAVRVLDQGGAALGTGFIVSVASKRLDVRYGYLVTAHHVVEHDPQISIQATDPYAFREGRHALYEPLPLKGWWKPFDGVDLAIAHTPWRTDQAWAALRFEHDLLPTETVRRERHPAPGESAHYIGLFTPLERVIVRSGSIAALDQTDIPLGERCDGSFAYEYPTHLLDCRSYDGFSGSPCFLDLAFSGLQRIEPPFPAGDQEPSLPPMGTMVYGSICCGMFTEHYDQRKADRAVSRLGVGFMVRSDEIKEALMTDKAIKERDEWDAENLRIREQVRAAAEDKPTPASASPTNEFENFETLARQVVNTPKPE